MPTSTTTTKPPSSKKKKKKRVKKRVQHTSLATPRATPTKPRRTPTKKQWVPSQNARPTVTRWVGQAQRPSAPFGSIVPLAPYSDEDYERRSLGAHLASTTTVRKERSINSERVLSTLVALHKRYELNRTMSKLAFQNRDMSNVEFVATLKKLYNYHLSKKMCRSLFACIDKDGSGYISWLELREQMLVMKRMANRRKKQSTAKKAALKVSIPSGLAPGVSKKKKRTKKKKKKDQKGQKDPSSSPQKKIEATANVDTPEKALTLNGRGTRSTQRRNRDGTTWFVARRSLAPWRGRLTPFVCCLL